MYYCYLDTPIGELLLAGEGGALSLIGFPKGSMRREPEPDWIFNEKPLANVREQLVEYFAGERRDFDLPLQLTGTEFQVSVLEALQDIPYGETVSYGDIAKTIGRPKAVRAVGAANGRNPIPIVVPCHRAVGPPLVRPARETTAAGAARKNPSTTVHGGPSCRKVSLRSTPNGWRSRPKAWPTTRRLV